MPSVPLSKETPVKGPVCPHAAKVHNHTNGEAKLREGSFPLNGVDKLPAVVDTEEANRAIQLNTKNAAADRKWIRPDLPSRCKWSLGASKADSPHAQVPRCVQFSLLLHMKCLDLQFKNFCKIQEPKCITVQMEVFILIV